MASASRSWEGPSGVAPVVDTAIAVDLRTMEKINCSTAHSAQIVQPYAPLSLDGKKAQPVKISVQSPWRWRLLLGAMADGVRLTASGKSSRAAAILSSDHGMPAIRLAGVQVGTGKTAGFRELIVPLPPKAASKMQLAGRGDTDEPSLLANRLIDAVDAMSRRLRTAMWTLFDKPDGKSPTGSVVAERVKAFETEAGFEAATRFTRLLADEGELDLEAMALDHLNRAPSRNPLLRARAEENFRRDLKMTTEQPALQRRIWGTLQHWRKSMTPDERAVLRSGGDSMALWRCLAAIPDDELAATEKVWMIAIRHLATCRPGGAGAGKALARSDYPEARMLSLLAARDPGQVAQAIGWLQATELPADISHLITFAVADILGDREAREWGNVDLPSTMCADRKFLIDRKTGRRGLNIDIMGDLNCTLQ